MQRIKSFGVMSVAKLVGVLYAGLGLLLAPFFLIAALIGMAAGEAAQMAPLLVFAVIAPVFYGVIGFIFGALGAWLYNLVAAKLGGIEVELG